MADGVRMEDVICDEKCSPDFEQNEQETWRWTKHVLPQLRNKKVFQIPRSYVIIRELYKSNLIKRSQISFMYS